MKRGNQSDGFMPFKNLKSLLKSSAPVHEKKRPEPTPAKPHPQTIEAPSDPPPKDISFKEFVKDLTPIKNNRVIKPARHSGSRPKPYSVQEQNAQKHLRDIVEKGRHFTINNIPEYMEGTGYNVLPGITRRLHQGDFSIQAHVDLHGLNREEAKAVFDNFVQESINSDKRMLLVIHGRGLSSPGKPVLKNLVSRWLTSGPWRKWVLAFSSAQAADGGSGATYVLLRKKPTTKLQRKGKRIKVHKEF